MPAIAELIAQGCQARRDRQFAVARAYYAQAAKLYREANDSLAYAHSIRHIADIYRLESNAAEAKTLYEECLELYRSNLDTKFLDLANTLRPYALLNEEQGNLALATMLWEEARSLYASLRIDAGVSECDAHLSHLKSP
jgi:tetratricopeptide (TPR) repeat protein